ncbi:MAG: signal peptidase I [Candidatus Pacearchaeota archaeon]|jgi:signal peptidase I
MAEEKGLKYYLKRFWFLLWKDDSLKGWIFSIIFLFIFIKFIFFPVLSLATGTSLPLAIVESCSMYHQGNLFSDFNAWWTRHDAKYALYIINELDFQAFPLKNGFNKGDILFIVHVDPSKLKVGDIIIFNAGQANPIIHRIVNITETNGQETFSTEGDNNNGQLTFENGITGNQIVGKAVLKVAPYLGWVKLIFYDWEKPVGERGFCHEN